MDEVEHDLTGAVFSAHAREELATRHITVIDVRRVLLNPGRTEMVRAGRLALTSLEGPTVLRVFVDVDREPPVVVTAYRSSKIRKYWTSP